MSPRVRTRLRVEAALHDTHAHGTDQLPWKVRFTVWGLFQVHGLGPGY